MIPMVVVEREALFENCPLPWVPFVIAIINQVDSITHTGELPPQDQQYNYTVMLQLISFISHTGSGISMAIYFPYKSINISTRQYYDNHAALIGL